MHSHAHFGTYCKIQSSFRCLSQREWSRKLKNQYLLIKKLEVELTYWLLHGGIAVRYVPAVCQNCQDLGWYRRNLPVLSLYLPCLFLCYSSYLQVKALQHTQQGCLVNQIQAIRGTFKFKEKKKVLLQFVLLLKIVFVISVMRLICSTLFLPCSETFSVPFLCKFEICGPTGEP